MLNLAFQMLGDIGAAEDVAQEAFVRLVRTPAGQLGNVRGWLTVVAGRLCLDHADLARVRREYPRDPGDVAAFEASPPVNQLTSPDPADRGIQSPVSPVGEPMPRSVGARDLDGRGAV